MKFEKYNTGKMLHKLGKCAKISMQSQFGYLQTTLFLFYNTKQWLES